MKRLLTILAVLACMLTQASSDLLLLGAGPAAIGIGTWTPAQLPGLVVWLDAGLGVSQVAGVVSSWTDQSPNAYVFAQGTPANKPTFSATGFNSAFPGVTTLVASPQFLTNAGITLASTTFSIFVTVSRTANAQVNGGVVSLQCNGCADDFHPPGIVVESEAGGFNFFTGAGAIGNGASSILVANNTAATIGVIGDSVNGNAYLNEVVQGAATAFSSTIGASPNLVAIGTRPWNGNTPSFDGTYASIIMTNTAMSASDRTKLSTYLSARYGCTC